MLHQIVTAEPRANLIVCLVYADGETVEVDFSPLIARGGVFSALANPALFKQVQVGGDGRYIEWPGEIDFCADALRHGTAIAARP